MGYYESSSFDIYKNNVSALAEHSIKTNNSLKNDAHTTVNNATRHLYVCAYLSFFTMLVRGRRAFIRSSGLVCPVTGRVDTKSFRYKFIIQ